MTLFAVGAVGVVLVGRRQRGRDPVGVRRAFAVVLVCVAVPGQVLQLTPAEFDLGSSLPLQLCDLAWLTAAWALWTRARVPAALTYYWGLTLTVQGIATPSLGQSFPDPRFLLFWALHLMVVWAALYLSLGLGIGPGWREYRVTVAVTVVWAVLTYSLDRVLGVNYGYLVRKPGSASLFDPLGAWPDYVLTAMSILLVVWALITWPWSRRTPARAG